MRCLLKRIMNTSKMKRKMKGVAAELMQPYHYYINEKCIKITSMGRMKPFLKHYTAHFLRTRPQRNRKPRDVSADCLIPRQSRNCFAIIIIFQQNFKPHRARSSIPYEPHISASLILFFRQFLVLSFFSFSAQISFPPKLTQHR